LIQIQRGSRDKIPLFLIHAIGGDVFTYYKVAQGLGSDQPVYAFRALSLDNQREPIDDIKYMAKVYIEVLLEYYREQNKRLTSFAVGGHSFGGIVAYEMAQQLYSVHNIQVSLLILIDTPVKSSLPSKLMDDQQVVEFITKNWTYLKEQQGFEPENIVRIFMKTWIAHQNAMHSYEPQVYHNRVIYFRATNMSDVFVMDPIIPWFHLVPHGIQAYTVPGDHNSMMLDPNVKTLCNHLKQVLDTC
jgi:thioesterase domain-containing protein